MEKSKVSFIKDIVDIFIKKDEILPSFISLNINGDLIIDGFKKLNEYNDNNISVLAFSNIIYVSGNNLKIVTFNKLSIQIKGEISSIEIFKVI